MPACRALGYTAFLRKALLRARPATVPGAELSGYAIAGLAPPNFRAVALEAPACVLRSLVDFVFLLDIRPLPPRSG